MKGKNKMISLIQGDITEQDTDAIVNAANNSLMGGGGVDGAIHRAGGSEILRACKEIINKQGMCETSKAVITTGGNLKAKFVIHTVGPVYRGGKSGEEQLLYDSYYNSLVLAHQNSLKTISFPSISTGAYAYPIEKAAKVALTAVSDFLKEYNLEEIRFVLFSFNDLKQYQRAASDLYLENSGK